MICYSTPGPLIVLQYIIVKVLLCLGKAGEENIPLNMFLKLCMHAIKGHHTDATATTNSDSGTHKQLTPTGQRLLVRKLPLKKTGTLSA